MAVWVVIGVLGISGLCGWYATRRHAAEVEPTVREFAEFRDALSQQVAGVRSDTRTTRRHLDRGPDARLGGPDATS